MALIEREKGPGTAAEIIFGQVHPHTALEETVGRLGTAIKLGLLVPGERLPAERELCSRLGIARSTLRQALAALAESGYVHATRGRGGGTFVSEHPPPAPPPSAAALESWRESCDSRLAAELPSALLAAERAGGDELEHLEALVRELDSVTADFPAYRRADVRLHIALAEATHSAPLVRAMTEAQSRMGDLIALIAHPAPVLASSNAQHRRLVEALRERDGRRAMLEMTDHVRGTEHVLAGMLPAMQRQENPQNGQISHPSHPRSSVL